ncbi:MAG: hypothetical protein PW789_03795 [Edaphobacter sp.]|uniref:hypothetical protein n=1 Tax=Edaphobacter sp. TaxID=1934404 RepID=UPI00238A82B9|nr:hypothetical protein [Edaphobacter sp.]MDE1175708.1 hypothetical protein [Edaphobacter sp.]
MRLISRVILLFLLLPPTAPAMSAQSVWDKLKQAASQLPKETTNKSRPAAAQTDKAQPAKSQKPDAPAADRGFISTPETGTPELTASLAASSGFLEVTGIKVGMSVKDAVAALKAHNSLLKVTPQTYVHQLIPDQTLISGVKAEIPLVTGQIFESYEIAFSAQPSAGFVTAVTHNVHYPPGQQPAFTSAIEGMRAKYGKENLVPRANAADPSFFWIMDLHGNLISGPDLQRIVETCTSPFLSEEWERAADTVANGYDERKLSIGTLRCSNYATIGVFFQGSLIPGQKDYLLDNLMVVASNGALYRSATEATHAQYLAAQKQVDADKMNKAEKKGVIY